jgi:hypothetical protein
VHVWTDSPKDLRARQFTASAPVVAHFSPTVSPLYGMCQLMARQQRKRRRELLAQL